MAHPKRRQSTHRQGIRRSHLGLAEMQLNSCAHCGAPIRPHHVCDNCGWYGFAKGADKQGRDVLEKEDF
ncbi:50S ribosomal protein L32 [Engelhardtia mirabilis]|uniref:Large ribosomal subunit protein bL32 n=1 Tax=Engelhardtia mirabilis TaxID=2528011 RepID=A0A518BKL8_9BACT|nr:50S ribosomal protein L32 [Planctomycetes bacterium Pla133]QDV01853.1 50S ribosomal protein L32 [Planctomycetes bacterium Pla86]